MRVLLISRKPLRKKTCRRSRPSKPLSRTSAVAQPKLNSFVTLTPELALDAAKKAETAIMRGENIGLLQGLPISIKDLIPVKGVRYTMGSKAMANNIAQINAPVAERVVAAGGCIIGKTTSSEFGAKAVGQLAVDWRYPQSMERRKNIWRFLGRRDRKRRVRNHPVQHCHGWRRLHTNSMFIYGSFRHQAAVCPCRDVSCQRRNDVGALRFGCANGKRRRAAPDCGVGIRRSRSFLNC